MMTHASNSGTRAMEPQDGARALSEAGKLQLPLCLVRANERFAEGFLVTSVPVAERDAELLACGGGPVSLVLPVAEWHALKVPARMLSLEMAPARADEQRHISPGELKAGVDALLANDGATPPPWICCVVTRPGGAVAHWTPIEAAYELVQRSAEASTGALLRSLRVPAGEADPQNFFYSFARSHGLPCVDLFAFCKQVRAEAEPRLISLPVTTRLPIQHGVFTTRIFENPWTGAQHVAMVMGDVAGDEPVLVRMHSECFTGDIMGSLRCDCGPQLDAALAQVAREGRGIVLYLRQEGRGIGLYEKLRAYVHQDAGLDTVDANQALGFPPDLRSYLEAADMLRTLGVTRVRLLTNNPTKLQELAGGGVEVVGREPLIIEPNSENTRYLTTKRIRMGHMLLPHGG